VEPPFPPFEPHGEPGRPGAKIRNIPIRRMLPNLITVLAICAGLSGIRLAFEGRFEIAVVMVLIAAFLDGIDGRLARMLKATSKFGEQMDSLADIVNFGAAPALVLYAFLLDRAGPVGWIAALLFAIACGLRLARFNVQLEDPNSFVSRLREILAVRDRHGLATAQQVDIPAVSNKAMLVLVHRLAEADQVTVLNFSAQTISGSVRSDELQPGSKVIDMVTGAPVGEVDDLHSLYIVLQPHEGRSLLVTPPVEH